MAILLKNDILQVSGNILGNYITNRPPKHEITSTNTENISLSSKHYIGKEST